MSDQTTLRDQFYRAFDAAERNGTDEGQKAEGYARRAIVLGLHGRTDSDESVVLARVAFRLAERVRLQAERDAGRAPRAPWDSPRYTGGIQARMRQYAEEQ
jgi:hypothetical protein